MLLLNAPLPCVDPAMRALSMALDMQSAVQALIVRWRLLGYSIGFGVGVATGAATVGRIGYEGRIEYTAIGRIGYEGRIEYTAIGSVVNLASRICSSAEDGQVIVDSGTAAVADAKIDLEPLGARPMKGFAQPVPVFLVKPMTGPLMRFDAEQANSPPMALPPG
jgi:class 3 adenylate cyclase